MNHAIFLFDYLAFLQKIQPLVEATERGDYTAVIEQARQVVSQIDPGSWILEDLGTSLKGFPNNDLGRMPISQITGLAFLVILSHFLEVSPIRVLGIGNLARVVSTAGWNENDLKLLSIGMSTTALIKPNSGLQPTERPPASDPRWLEPAYYWWWVRPANAFYTGWWDIQSIESLRDKLSPVQKLFETVRLENLNLHPSVTRTVLLKNYENTMKMFDLAATSNRGIFYIIS